MAHRRILIGTSNPSKYPYLCHHLRGTGIECISPASIGLSGFDAPETGCTAEENAVEKALAWHRASHLPVLALDAGSVFLDLPDNDPDQPGVHVRRACGHIMTDAEMLAWFSALAHKHGGRLRAAWQDSYCLMRDEAHRYVYTFDREMLAAHAFFLVDSPCSVRVPHWPLNSITVDIASEKYAELMTKEERIAAEETKNGQKQRCMQRLTDWMCRTAVAMLSDTPPPSARHPQ